MKRLFVLFVFTAAQPLACSTREYVVGDDTRFLPDVVVDAGMLDEGVRDATLNDVAAQDTSMHFDPTPDGEVSDVQIDTTVGAAPDCTSVGGLCVSKTADACAPANQQDLSCGDAADLVCCVP